MSEEPMIEDGAAGEQRLVHLDLKGAPPKLAYYEWLFPMLRRWGATGLLVEYEDSFPYSHDLCDLAAPHAYTEQEVERLQLIARQSDLAVIPLIQTFGHFEFVLKHDQWRPLREVEGSPMTLCPSKPEAFSVVSRMIDQVLRLHPHSTALHIGADEVFHIGLCPLCVASMGGGEAPSPQGGQEGEGRPTPPSAADQRVRLFLGHVRRVVKYIRSTHHPPTVASPHPPTDSPSGPPESPTTPPLRIIMWDDMLRLADPATLKQSGIGDMVELMVWYYQPNFDGLPGLLSICEVFSLVCRGLFASNQARVCCADVWPCYASVFKELWAASAYKGATGPCALTTDVGFHVENNKGWLELVRGRVKPLTGGGGFRGYALTGWQRYDHYAVLCELMPVGLPSLAVCLLTLTEGAFTLDVHSRASTDLHFSSLLPLNPLLREGVGVCEFPGSLIYRAVAELALLKADLKLLVSSDRVQGWMSVWHVRNNFTNPVHINHFLPQLSQMLQFLEALSATLRTALNELFPPYSTDEWLSFHLTPDLSDLRDLVHNANTQLAIGGRTRGGGAEGRVSVGAAANHATT